MPNYKEIARLKAAGQSNRTVADSLGISRNTVNAAVAFTVLVLHTNS